MGVKACRRKNCENIMCDTYISGLGYICYSCQNEFKDYSEQLGLDVSTEGKILAELELFMKTQPHRESGREISIDSFFLENTK